MIDIYLQVEGGSDVKGIARCASEVQDKERRVSEVQCKAKRAQPCAPRGDCEVRVRGKECTRLHLVALSVFGFKFRTIK